MVAMLGESYVGRRVRIRKPRGVPVVPKTENTFGKRARTNRCYYHYSKRRRFVQLARVGFPNPRRTIVFRTPGCTARPKCRCHEPARLCRWSRRHRVSRRNVIIPKLTNHQHPIFPVRIRVT